ncbi:Protein FRA10AC1 homolog [Coccomyxa sp. Obi]|nr:Protein FRA10AC1 homolog [Coccomyxa sp. Obi]
MQQGSDAAAAAAAQQQHRRQFLGLTAYDRHKRLMAEYVNFYGGRMPAPAEQPTVKTDYDVLREQYRFIRSEEEDAAAEDRWALRLAKRYYSKLYREYAIVDLSRYQEDKVGMRWRSEKEVIAGKGQFSCGARGCSETRGLATFEVPFGYQEAGEKKQALVKVRVCPEHAQQLNFRKNREALRAQVKAAKKQKHKRGSDPEAGGEKGRCSGERGRCSECVEGEAASAGGQQRRGV